VDDLRPRLHVFEHIHDQYGVARSATTTFVNASVCDEAYRPLHRPIVVDLGVEGVVVQGTEPTPRKQVLATVGAILGAARGAPPEIQALQVQAALRAMTELDGRDVAELEAEYVRRGLNGDLKRLTRAEDKPGRRPVPVREVQAGGA
jgi:hypothetical protein